MNSFRSIWFREEKMSDYVAAQTGILAQGKGETNKRHQRPV